ncbi:MAG TPA: BadF/BadG/BcrA/BcrD ATPase family protein [Lacipirellulaceae bacterium]|jgi:N-acetylglucosamine kinase-like BadF-type ATPase|nr:BadF/BadG/BcrA/BcrD ATPase family protein [Lacipirellulaceae bacterium]
MPPASDAAYTSAETSRGDLILAVDTGGTKTAAWLVESIDPDSHRLLGQARTAAGNPLSVGFEKATQAIHEALILTQKAAQLADRRAVRAVFSIAGAANRNMTDRFVAWARSIGVADRVAIVSDLLPILAAGTPDCCGVALISGTGSSAFGRAVDGRTKRCGGWGYMLGDEGSGYAIGRAALQFTLRSIEESATASELATAVLNAVGVKTVTELTRAIYGDEHPRHAVAALAPLVCSCADNGDPNANAILNAVAVELAELAYRTARAVGVADSGFPLALSGGLIMNSPSLLERLRTELLHRNLRCEINVVREPLTGCVRLAEPKCDALLTWHACS